MHTELKHTKNDLMFTYVLFTSLFFFAGTVICNILSADSNIYKLSSTYIIKSLSVFHGKNIKETLFLLAEAFSEEIRYIFFAFVASFTVYSEKIYAVLCSFRSIMSGYCVSIAVNSIRTGELASVFPFLACILTAFLSVASLTLLCHFCVSGTLFSIQTASKLTLKQIIKRKVFYLHILKFSCVCGAYMLILLLRYINCIYLIF